MAGKQLNVAVIGAGFIADTVHIPYLKQSPATQVKALVDIDRTKAEIIGAKHGISAIMTDYHALLDDQSIDVIDVCTPPGNHVEIIKEAANHHKSIIVEKPMALTFDEAIAIRDTVAETGVGLGVVLNLRYMPLSLSIISAVNGGAIGSLRHIAATMHTIVPESSWLKDSSFRGYGVLYDFFPHVIDLLMWVTQGTPKSVYCHRTGDGHDGSYEVDVEFSLPSGRCSSALIDLNWTASTSRRTIEFYGTDKDLVVDLQDQFLQVTGGYVTPITRAFELALRSMTVGRRVAGGLANLRLGAMIYHKSLLLDFLQSFASGQSPRISVLDGLLHMAVIDAAIRSVESGMSHEINWGELQ